MTSSRVVAGLLAVSLATGAVAYTFPGNSNATNEGRQEWPTSAFTWRFNASTSDALPSVVDGSDPRGAIAAAFAQWQAESAAAPTQGADTPTTDTGNDGINVITFADTPGNRSTVGGALAVCIFFTDATNGIVGADIVFNPTEAWSTTGGPPDAIPVSAVATHEIGHWHGLAHSPVVGATMYPFAGDFGSSGSSELVPDSISTDDKSAANVSYPDPVHAAATGRIAGRVTANGNPVFGAHVFAEDIATGAAVAGNITLGSNQGARHGRYEIAGLPPGTYRIHAEPLDSPATFANWRNNVENGWFNVSLAAFDTNFLTTTAAGTVTVARGSTSTVNIAVPVAAPQVNVTRVGLGSLDCPGGFSFSTASLPVSVAPGATTALALSGIGLEQALGATVAVSDPSITLDAACRRYFGAGASATLLVRMTIPANARPGPRTIWVTLPSSEKGALVGALEIEGPATEAGLCGNGIDDDGDGLMDNDDIECFDDLCPLDPLKTSPGQCGCGNPDGDSDLDGVANCVDGCPSDSNKTAPGACGCGVADTDSDLDGTANCVDGCPSDSNKTTPGACGCGNSDVNTDGDAQPDCLDGCATDPLKVAPGACGCGNSDVNTDGDARPDCAETCDADPLKLAPGACGCGVPESGDGDGDGVLDCVDNCPATSNASQTDSDMDGTGDACEVVALRAGATFTESAGGRISVPLYIGTPSAECLSRIALRAEHAADLAYDGFSDAPAGCSPAVVSPMEGVLDIELACSPGLQSDGLLGLLAFVAGGIVDPIRLAVRVTNAIAEDCEIPPVVQPTEAADGFVTVGCAPGDIRDSPLGPASVVDCVELIRILSGAQAPTARSTACADLSPGADTCSEGDGGPAWCVAGNGSLTEADLRLLRQLAVESLTLGCSPCAGAGGP